MVEEYLDGPQVSTESIVVIGGRCLTPGFSDRNYEYLERYAPFFIENGGDLPSHLPPDIQAKVKDVVAQAALALGVIERHRQGRHRRPQWRAARHRAGGAASGGFFCTREIPLNTGVDFIGAAIKVALGRTGFAPEELARPRTGAGDPALCLSRSRPRGADQWRGRSAHGCRRRRSGRHGKSRRRDSAGRRQAPLRRHGAGNRCNRAMRRSRPPTMRCRTSGSRPHERAVPRARRSRRRAGTLNLFALFHLNLAFSSIEEEQRAGGHRAAATGRCSIWLPRMVLWASS